MYCSYYKFWRERRDDRSNTNEDIIIATMYFSSAYLYIPAYHNLPIICRRYITGTS